MMCPYPLEWTQLPTRQWSSHLLYTRMMARTRQISTSITFDRILAT